MIILMKSKIILLLFALGFVWFIIYKYATEIDVFTLDTNWKDYNGSSIK